MTPDSILTPTGVAGTAAIVCAAAHNIARVGVGVKWSQVLKKKFPVESILEEEVS